MAAPRMICSLRSLLRSAASCSQGATALTNPGSAAACSELAHATAAYSSSSQHVAAATPPSMGPAASSSAAGGGAWSSPSHQTSNQLSGWGSGLMPSLPSTLSYSQYRSISSSRSACHGGGSKSQSGESISVTFIDKDNQEHTVRAPIGSNLLDVAHDNEIELEGACEGSLACSTCHVVVEDDAMFKKMPEPCEDELDMLDLAFGLTETSRLGCQLIATKELDGLRVRIPAASRNFYVDGHKPKPH